MLRSLWKNSVGLLVGCPLICFGMMLSGPSIAQTPPKASNVPPAAVMDKFYDYLNGSYSLYLGDDRGACSYSVDPSSIKRNGSDRFFLAKLSRGKMGTACRGVLAFQIMQADCKARKLYLFQRENKEDIRFAGWERYEARLSDPEQKGPELQAEKMFKSICR